MSIIEVGKWECSVGCGVRRCDVSRDDLGLAVMMAYRLYTDTPSIDELTRPLQGQK